MRLQKADEIIIEEFLAGDEQAFSLLVDKYVNNLQGFVFGIVKERMATEDIVQETFVKVWKNISRFDRSKKFKTWLFTIGKNTAMDFLKKKKTTPFSFFRKEEGDSFFENVVDENELADQILVRSESGKDLEKALGHIKEKYRIILELCYIEDMTLAEISEVLEIPYNTIKSQHTRALSALRDVLG